MDLFPIGAFVRLRNRARGKYLHADEDAIHVSLRPLGAVPSLNAVWKVGHRPVEGGGNDVLLLLQGAAYGQYLAVAHEDEVTPSGVRVIQRDYNLPSLDPLFMWTPYRVEAGQNYVRLHDNDQRCLRANGRYRNWNNLVSVDVRNGDETTMMHWRVEAIPSTPEPLPLPPPPQPPIRVRRGLFRRRMHQHPGRRIWHFRLDDDGNLVSDDWPSLVSHDNSLANLRAQVARLEHDENITLGVRAGYNARVIPLVTNLPNNADPMQIIVYTTGSPGMPKALIYIEEKMEMRRNDGQAYQEWLELSDPSSESDDEDGDPTYHPNEGNKDGEGSNGAGYGGSSGGGDDDNSSGDDDNNDSSDDDDDGDDGSDDNDSSDEDEEDSDYVPDLQDDEDDDEEYMALVAAKVRVFLNLASPRRVAI